MLAASGAAPATRPAPPPPVRCATWPVPDGGSITDTLAEGLPPGGPLPAVRDLPTFELDPAPADGHVYALSATVRPPATGDYRFAIAADDTAVLYVSTDEQPAHRRQVASVPAYTPPRAFTYYRAQRSATIHLLAGHAYAVEAWAQNAAGVGHVSVAWRLPDGTVEAPIPAARLSPPAAPPRLPSVDVGPVTATLSDDPEPIARPGFHKLVGGAHCRVGTEPVDVSVLLYLPEHFDTTTDRRAMLVFLHGNGHQGTDLWGAVNEGPADYLANDAALRAAFPMVAVVPQLPPGWRWDHPGAAAMVNAVVRQLCQRYPRFDTNRVYLTGLSMGGKGAWLAALDAPELYADVTTFSAVAVRPRSAGARLAGIPYLHLVCGGDDGEFAGGSRAMADALRPALGNRAELTVVPHAGHDVWRDFYGDPAFYRDLLRHAR